VRITRDTAILVRAHQNADGLARALLIELLAAKHVLVLSGPMLEELERVLSYPRLIKTTKLSPLQVAEYLEFLSTACRLVEMEEELPAPIRDPKDIQILQTAVAGNADIICTLDRHFYDTTVLEYCNLRGIKVLNDIELVRLIRGELDRA
jgi:putative PIN family toxin of toxin-antitoxin system